MFLRIKDEVFKAHEALWKGVRLFERLNVYFEGKKEVLKAKKNFKPFRK